MFRSRPVMGIAIVCLGLGGSGCHDAPRPIVGVSPPRPADRSRRPPDAAAPEPSPVDADFRAHMKKTGDRFLSVGHGQRFDAVLWVNDSAQAHWDEPEGMPEGAILVEETMITEAGTVRAGGLLVMVKGPAEWRYVTVSPEGEVSSDARLQACGLCHREAHGSVFSFSTAAGAGGGGATTGAPR